MKGDKGKPASSTYLRCHHQAQHPEAYDNKLVEFAGTLLGFDDYVSKFSSMPVETEITNNLPKTWCLRM